MKDAQGHGSNPRGAAKPKKPIPDHIYHTYSDMQLRYILKDAHEAGRNAQEMGDERGVNKYADQVNDASTVLGYRRSAGVGPDNPGNQAAARALASGPKSASVPAHNAHAPFSGYANAEEAKRMKLGQSRGGLSFGERYSAEMARRGRLGKN